MNPSLPYQPYYLYQPYSRIPVFPYPPINPIPHINLHPNPSRRGGWSALSLLLIAAVLLHGLWTSAKWREDSVLIWDAAGYHTYLPGFFIYKDLKRLDWYGGISDKYHPAAMDRWYAVFEAPAVGGRFTKYPVGRAVLETPFFLSAHALARLSGKWPADGYSRPYQLAAAVADGCFLLIGLLLLRAFLRRWFRDGAVAAGLLLLFFGTNLYREALYDYGTSHVAVFGLLCAVLWANDRWRRKGGAGWALLAGLLCGLTTITRPTEGLIVLPLLLWNVAGRNDLRAAWQHWKKAAHWLPFALGFLLMLAIQCSYWRYSTGRWILFSYAGEYFDFRHPMLFKGLFGFRKGWFVYTPLALLILLAGLPALYRKRRGLVLPVLAYLLPAIYVAFSWWMWFYASSFGCRALVGSYALLSLPLAALLQRSAAWKGWRRGALYLLMAACVLLNQFQTWQYQHGLLSWDRMTAKRYWNVFGKTAVLPPAEDELVPESNYLERPPRSPGR